MKHKLYFFFHIHTKSSTDSGASEIQFGSHLMSIKSVETKVVILVILQKVMYSQSYKKRKHIMRSTFALHIEFCFTINVIENNNK